MDRGIIPGSPTSFIEFIQSTLHTNNTGVCLGGLNSSFIIGYTAASAIVGHFVHVIPPMRVISLGLSIHSIAVFLSGLSFYFQSYWCLLFARCLSGVGEASFCSIAPNFIDDKISPKCKGQCMSMFYVAIPVGMGVGYVFSGQISARLGWQFGFFFQLFPFIPCVLYCFFLDGLRFSSESASQTFNKNIEKIHEHNIVQVCDKSNVVEDIPPNLNRDLKLLFSSTLYVLTVFGEAASCFVFAGLSAFAPELVIQLGFMHDQASSSLYFGIVVTIAGICGSLLSGIAFDRFNNPSDPSSNLNVGLIHQNICAVAAFSFMIFIPFARSAAAFFSLCFFGLLACTATYTPTLFVLVRVVPKHARSLGLGVQNAILHILGDVPSPVIIGALIDHFKVEGAGGYRKVGFCIIIWLIWMVFFWTIALIHHHYHSQNTRHHPMSEERTETDFQQVCSVSKGEMKSFSLVVVQDSFEQQES